MDKLDAFLLSRQVDLEDEEDRQSLASNESSASNEIRTRVADSLFRSDMLAPQVIKFSSTYKPYRKHRQLLVILVVVGLSISAIFYFSGTVWSLSHEEILDIESKKFSSLHSNATAFEATSNFVP